MWWQEIYACSIFGDDMPPFRSAWDLAAKDAADAEKLRQQVCDCGRCLLSSLGDVAPLCQLCSRFRLFFIIHHFPLFFIIFIIFHSHVHHFSSPLTRLALTSLLSRVFRANNTEQVHLVYGLAKDFGVSGLRIGALASRNKELLDAHSNLGYWIYAPMIRCFTKTAPNYPPTVA